MATYSTGTPPTDATKLIDFQSVLNILPDNTSKLIEPKDVRDAVFTTWENIAFKPTTAGGPEYIGIDQASLKEKIFIGKKAVGGQNVMNTTLLNTDIDIFFYNTKTEPQANYHTTLAILAGTGSNTLYGGIFAPYLKSTDVVNPGSNNTIDFEINNPTYYTVSGTSSGGNISLRSEYGNVLLNGIRWPTFAENTVGIGNDNYVLKYKWIGGQAYARWEVAATYANIDTIYSPGTVSITGNPVLINGFPIEFTSNVPVPTAIGGVPAGTTFSNMPLVEVIRMILYPYIAPTLTTNFTYNLIEIGDTITAPLQRFNFSIYKNSTYSTTNFFTTPGIAGLPAPGTIVNGSTTGQFFPTGFNVSSQSINGAINYVSWTWSATIADTYPTTITSTSSFLTVIPWFYGTATFACTQSFGTNNIMNILGTSSNPTLGKLTKLIAGPALSANPVYNKTVTLSTNGLPNSNQGFVYFGYPSAYPDLSTIKDQNGFDITGAFSKFTISGIHDQSLPNSRWINRTYKFYIFVGATGSTPILTQVGSFSTAFTADWQFNFA